VSFTFNVGECNMLSTSIFLASLVLIVPAQKGPPEPKVRELTTPTRIRFALIGEKGSKPAPTLFFFAGAATSTLLSGDFTKCGHLLMKDGVLLVAIDIPAHGDDVRKGEPPGGINGWRHRLEKGEDPIRPFTKKVSKVLDYLVKEGYTDPKRVGAVGTSRGGFIASHVAAADPRFQAIVQFAPVTDLLAVREFKGLEKHALTTGLHVTHLTYKLAGRSFWFCIGNNDTRVSTDETIAFTRKLVRAAEAKKAKLDVYLVVAPTPGHTIHKTAHDEAATWLRQRLQIVAPPAK
jgi:esterase FrsA